MSLAGIRKSEFLEKILQALAMQIGRFTGDVPGAEFAKQNIYLAEKIAKKYNLEIALICPAPLLVSSHKFWIVGGFKGNHFFILGYWSKASALRLYLYKSKEPKIFSSSVNLIAFDCKSLN